MPDRSDTSPSGRRLIARLPFFYGWIVLAAGTIGVLMSVPGQTIGVSMFTDSLLAASGLERLELSLAYLLGTLGSAALLSWAGKLYDRWGARVMGVSAALVLGAVLMSLSGLGPKSGGMKAFAYVATAFFLLRFAGQGVLTVASRSMVMKWFDRRRGLANAFLGVATSFGFSYAPRLLDGFIEAWGWRGAFKMLALICGAAFSLFALLTYRDDPRPYGLVPDGRLHDPPTSARGRRARPERDSTLGEALRTRVFWILTLTLTLSALVMTAFTFHVISIFDHSGMDRAQAVAIFLPASVVAVGLQALGSYLSDFVKFKYFSLLQLSGILVASTGLLVLGPGWPLALLIVGNGMSQAMFSVNIGVAWPRYFGVSHLGAITGFAMAWITAGSAVGPYLYSLLLGLGRGYAAGAGVSILAAASLLVFAVLGYDRDY